MVKRHDSAGVGRPYGGVGPGKVRRPAGGGAFPCPALLPIALLPIALLPIALSPIALLPIALSPFPVLHYCHPALLPIALLSFALSPIALLPIALLPFPVLHYRLVLSDRVVR